jgi:glycosyltransferase involved in cell wall biosynthesis
MIYWLFRRPRVFMRLIGEALRDHALPELGLASQFSREMKRNKISMIHCHFADRKMFTTYFASILAAVPYTVTLHSHELVFYSKRDLFRKALSRCTKVVVQCEYNRQALLKEGIIPPEKIELIRALAPLAEFASDRRMKVLTVAKFYDYKGFDVLVEAARTLKEEPIVFWIVGGGPVNVRAMSSDLIASGTVKMLGPVDEDILKILYDACDVFCLPSKTAPSGQKEGLPMSIIEAMSFSKPIVTTAHAGIPELVERIVVPENDPKGIADALRGYMEAPEARAQDGIQNRLVVERMNGPMNAEKLLAMFDSLT